ncbi:MAG TPA: hypothetical protein VFS05_01305 [Gemmatimonadaceae bacterium]|nr:hypothetical protein [Gemmatimonadaceae bacterium]
MRAVVVTSAVLALAALAACKKTGEGEYEVQKPVIGLETDTVHVPQVEVKKDTHVVVTPDVKVKAPAERRGDSTRRR